MSIGKSLGARADLHRRGNVSLRRWFRNVAGAALRGVWFLLAGLAAIGVWFLLAGLAAIGVCRGQEESKPAGDRAEKRVVRVFGVVRDAADRPVSEATVWLAESDARGGRPPARVSETRSGADGEFSFYRAVEKETVLYLIARDAQGRLVWSGSLIRPGQNVIRLREVCEVRGRVMDSDGQPIAGARVSPRMFLYLPPGERASGDFIEPFAELAAEFETHTAADGSFVLHRVPKDVHVSCEVSAPGFGRPRATFAAHDSVTIKLQRAGKLSGALGPLAGVDAARGGYKLRIAGQSPEHESGPTEGVKLSYFEDFSTADDGTFRTGDLPPGRYSIVPVAGQGRPFFAHPTIHVEVKPGETTQGVSVPLVSTVRVTGQVVERDTHKGVAGVGLWVYQQSPAADFGRPSASQHTISDEDGRFEFRLPPGATRVGKFEVPREFFLSAGQPPDRWEREIADGDEWPTFELSRAAEVEGVVVDEGGQPAPHAELFIDNLSGVSGRPFDWLPSRTDGNGRFVLNQLDPELTFSLRARTPDAVTDGMATISLSELKGPAKITVSKKHLFRVRGKVIDDSGQPLPEATVSLQWSHEVHNDRAARMGRGRGVGVAAQRFGPMYQLSKLEPFAARADGKFESPALWPRDSYYATVSAPGYASLDTAQVQGTAGGVHDFGAIVLRRNDLVVSGVVVDENGQAVADAEIAVVWPPGPAKPSTRSNAEGRFSITDVDSAIPLPLRARTADAATTGATVVLPADFDKPVKLLLSARNAFRLRGKVVDRHGKPAPGASVSVVWRHRGPDERSPYALAGGRRILGRDAPALNKVAPAADGDFETPALWPDENYHLVASAPGYVPVESAVIYGPAGETTVVESLVLSRNDLKLEGRVVNSAGQPLEGATVVNSGDADKRLVSITDAGGRFALEGLYDGPVHLLARLSGYRAAGWRGAASGEAIEITLSPSDQPSRPVALAKVDESARFAAERVFARRLLCDFWALRERFDDNPRLASASNAPRRGFGGRVSFGSQSETITRLAELMARLDLAQAMSWSVSEGGLLDDQVRLAAVAGNLHVNVDQALQLFSGERSYAARNALVTRARLELDAGHQDRALRLLEAAMAVATSAISANPSAKEVELASAGAQIGALAIRAGDRPWGRQLVLRAADAAEKFAPNPQTEMIRGRAAAALAAIYPARALQLLRDMQAPANGRALRGGGVAQSIESSYSYLGRAAAAAAGSDLDRAREILKLVESPIDADRARLLIAYELATRDPAAAVSTIDEISETDLWIKADALCWLAVALADRDKPQASALIDRALDLYLDAPPAYHGAVKSGRPVEAARVALAARAVGYPDLPGVVDRVLALRLTAAEVPSPAKLVESTINMARVLALVDPAIARELLTSVELHKRLIGADESATPGGRAPFGRGSDDVAMVGRGEWLQGWALADLQEAERRCDEEFARLKQQSKIDTAILALLPLVELLVTPPAERERYLLRSIDPRYWFPGDDEP